MTPKLSWQAINGNKFQALEAYTKIKTNLAILVKTERVKFDFLVKTCYVDLYEVMIDPTDQLWCIKL